MNDAVPQPPPLSRREIIEERGNRDAFRLALILGALLILQTLLAILCVLKTHVIVIPVPEFERTRLESPAPKKFSAEFKGVSGNTMYAPAGLRRSAAAQPRPISSGHTPATHRLVYATRLVERGVAVGAGCVARSSFRAKWTSRGCVTTRPGFAATESTRPGRSIFSVS